MLDIFDRIERDSGGPIGQYFSQAYGYYMYPRLEGELGPHMIFNGTEVLNWSLNNYLGLANHPEVRKELIDKFPGTAKDCFDPNNGYEPIACVSHPV